MSTSLRPGYGIIHRCVMEYAGLSRDAKALYALIQSYTGANEVCWPSGDTLAENLGCTPRSIINWIAELESKRLLAVERTDGKVNKYRPLVPEDLVNQDSGVNRDSQGGEPAFTPTSEPAFTQRLTSEKKQRRRTSPGKPEGMPEDFYFQVIDYLNDTGGRDFKDTTRGTRELINARWNEGYRADDFEAVIDGKWAEWKGTKFAQWFQPETLFCAKHFESYLQAAKSRRVS